MVMKLFRALWGSEPALQSPQWSSPFGYHWRPSLDAKCFQCGESPPGDRLTSVGRLSPDETAGSYYGNVGAYCAKHFIPVIDLASVGKIITPICLQSDVLDTMKVVDVGVDQNTGHFGLEFDCNGKPGTDSVACDYRVKLRIKMPVASLLTTYFEITRPFLSVLTDRGV